MLHPYLRERLCGRIAVAPTASMDEIRSAALALEAEEKRTREAALIEKLRAGVNTGQRAAAGLDPVLRALQERRVEQLLVSAGFTQPGWSCKSCEALATIGRTCPVCGTEGMEAVDDVVEEAVDHSLAQGVKVHVCDGNADLDVLGRVGALLRY